MKNPPPICILFKSGTSVIGALPPESLSPMSNLYDLRAAFFFTGHKQEMKFLKSLPKLGAWIEELERGDPSHARDSDLLSSAPP